MNVPDSVEQNKIAKIPLSALTNHALMSPSGSHENLADFDLENDDEIEIESPWSPSPNSRTRQRDAEIISRRRISAIASSLGPTNYTTSKDTVLVPKSPSPKKSGNSLLARTRLGLEKQPAQSITLTRKPSSGISITSFDHGSQGSSDKLGSAPSADLKSSRLARADQQRLDAAAARVGTVYSGIKDSKLLSGISKSRIAGAGLIEEATRQDEDADKISSFADGWLKMRSKQREKRQHSQVDMHEKSSVTQGKLLNKRIIPEILHRQTEKNSNHVDSSSDLSEIREGHKSSETPPSTPPVPEACKSVLPAHIQPTQHIQYDIERYDPYSKIHLANRRIPSSEVDKAMIDVQAFTVSTIFAEIHPPDYLLPDYADYAVFGIMARKSEVKYFKTPEKFTKPAFQQYPAKISTQDEQKTISQAINEPNYGVKNGHYNAFRKTNVKAKQDLVDDTDEEQMKKKRYFILTLTDLYTEIDVFVKGSDLDKYFRIRQGDLVAIINPGILPSRASDAKFRAGTGFKLQAAGEPDNALLEIGRAKDFGLCKAITKKETPCKNWVNLKRTEYCEFHLELAVKRTSSRRADINKGTQMFSPKNRDGRMILTRNANGYEGLLPNSHTPRLDKSSGGRVFTGQVQNEGHNLFDMPMRTTNRPW
ncbi:uncharacterized protein V1516DRAFT_678990 [Lipomyces oligophaga]|uniref:uncharacterized protein n=1 Tax=Lipomyces oligophaga TaxID=45792 RepID=UPI0034CED950